LIDVKNQKIVDLEDKIHNLKDIKSGNKENNVAGKSIAYNSKKENETPQPKTKKDQKILEKTQNMDLEIINSTLKEQNLVSQKKIKELSSQLEDTEQS